MVSRFDLARVEGGAGLTQDGEGRIRLWGPPTRDFERILLGRQALDAVVLTQQISGDGGISHAIAAVNAWEAAVGTPVAENGRILRDLLHALSLIHSHIRNFYLQLLPDYLPERTLEDYSGAHPTLLRMRSEVLRKPKGDWTRWNFDHPFSLPETQRLWEHKARAMNILDRLGRMMALIGGKFPVVMSLVPGGVSLNLDEHVIFRLMEYLDPLREFLNDTVFDDGLLLLNRHPDLKTLGLGGKNFLSVGAGEDEVKLESSLFPSGIMMGGLLEPFAPVATESIRPAFYRMNRGGAAAPSALPIPDSGKPGAYSWIKAPRYQKKPMETGAVPRLTIAYLSGARPWKPGLVDEVEAALGVPIKQANTVGGRILARLGEVRGLADRSQKLLEQLDPMLPAVSAETAGRNAGGEGLEYVEAPAGTLRHKAIYEKGRIVYYDIVSPNTWNGSPSLGGESQGPLEAAMSRGSFSLENADHRRSLSRIVQSFAFSMSDAVH